MRFANCLVFVKSRSNYLLRTSDKIILSGKTTIQPLMWVVPEYLCLDRRIGEGIVTASIGSNLLASVSANYVTRTVLASLGIYLHSMHLLVISHNEASICQIRTEGQLRKWRVVIKSPGTTNAPQSPTDFVRLDMRIQVRNLVSWSYPKEDNKSIFSAIK